MPEVTTSKHLSSATDSPPRSSPTRLKPAVIDAYRLVDTGQENQYFSLANAVLGHHHSTRGLASADVVTSLYDAPCAPEITEPPLLIKIPGLWTPTMTADELYRATRFWWKIGERRNLAK